MHFPRRLKHDQPAELVVHLDELRSRLIICLFAIAAGFAISYVFHPLVLEWLDRPLPPGRRHPVTFGIVEPFMISLKVSLAAGLALALPIILWQAWSYFAPAVEQHQQRTVARFVLLATALFAGGLAFAYRVALPAAVHFLTNYDNHLYDVQVRAQSYYSFALLVLVAIGIVFEVPIVVLALVRLRIMSAARLRRTWRGGLALMAAIGACLPGYDPITTLMEMLPLMALYLLAIGLASVLERRWFPRPAILRTEPGR